MTIKLKRITEILEKFGIDVSTIHISIAVDLDGDNKGNEAELRIYNGSTLVYSHAVDLWK